MCIFRTSNYRIGVSWKQKHSEIYHVEDRRHQSVSCEKRLGEEIADSRFEAGNVQEEPRISYARDSYTRDMEVIRLMRSLIKRN